MRLSRWSTMVSSSGAWLRPHTTPPASATARTRVWSWSLFTTIWQPRWYLIPCWAGTGMGDTTTMVH